MAQEIAVTGSRDTLLRPRTLDEAMRFADLIAKSNMIPPAYKGKPADILLAVQMGAELGLAPMQAIQNIACINGKPSVYGDAVLGLVRAFHGCEDVTETIEGQGDQMVAVCTAKRRGASACVARFSVEDAKKAALWGKAGPWQQYPKRMLAMRARGFALRDAFPDVLRGLITAEEAQDYPSREPIDVTPKADLDAFAAGAAQPTPESPREPSGAPPRDERVAPSDGVSGQQPTGGSKLLAAVEAKARLGTVALDEAMNMLSDKQAAFLRAHLPALRKIATEADLADPEPADEDNFPGERTDASGNRLNVLDAG